MKLGLLTAPFPGTPLMEVVDWTARRLGVTRQDVRQAVAIHAAATAAGKNGHSKQERRHGRKEPHQGRPRQKRVVCA